MAIKGIDVSTIQGDIDWLAVKAAGIDFAMVKATQGYGASTYTASLRKFTDSHFYDNITAASYDGLQCGAWHFLTAASADEAKEEADYFLEVIEPQRANVRLWAAVDVEDAPAKYNHLSTDRALLTDIVNVFTDRVEAAGYKPMIYTNRAFLRARLDFNRLHCQTIWRAHWFTNGATHWDEYPADSAPADFADDMPVWQLGKADNVPGINGAVDINWGLWEVQKMPDNTNVTDERDNAPAEWAEEAVNWATANGILYGDLNGDLQLHDGCTREQMVTFLHRLYKLICG